MRFCLGDGIGVWDGGCGFSVRIFGGEFGEGGECWGGLGDVADLMLGWMGVD